jgi:hypothetical protein
MKRDKIDGLINKWTHKKYLLTGSLLFIFIYLSPYFILGERSPLTIHDNLDSNIASVKTLLESGQIFSSNSSPINPVMNGIPRVSLYGRYGISLLSFWIFGMYWGYVANKAIIVLVGFCGMYILLKKHFIPENKHRLIQFGVAVTFALLPFWSFSLSVAGLPLLLYAFLNIRAKESHYSDWFIIGLFPFCSSLVSSGIFFIAVIVLIAAYDTIKTRSINYSLLMGLVLIGAMYVLSHHRLFYSSLINSEYVSHRYEFFSSPTGITYSIKKSVKLFIWGQYHAHSRHTFILIPVAVSLLLMWKNKETDKKFISLLSFIFVTSVWYGFVSWGPIKNTIASFISIPIQLQCFHFLSPMFWHVLFGLSLVRIFNKSHIGKYFVILCLILQIGYVFSCHELYLNRKSPSFSEFYAEEQFKKIKVFIGHSPDTYRVISLGIHPSVSQYNGFTHWTDMLAIIHYRINISSAK